MPGVDSIFEEYGLGELQEKMDGLFPTVSVDLQELLGRLLGGDVWGCLREVGRWIADSLLGNFSSYKSIFVWLLALGLIAALLSNFMEIMDNHQIADIGFYFAYLMMVVLLIRLFLHAASIAYETLDKIVIFIQLFIPAYFLSVGVAAGGMTAYSSYQVTILIIYLVEHVLLNVGMPFIYSYIMLSLVNGLWIEERLTLLVEGMEKCIRLLLKLSLGAVTGISILQSMITPVLDSAGSHTLQKVLAAVPGAGNVADGVMETVIGSAVIIKNSLGVMILILLLLLIAPPLIELLLTAGLLKAAAALLGIVSDRRITVCADRVGTGSALLLKMLATASLLFMVTISVAAYTTNRGF